LPTGFERAKETPRHRFVDDRDRDRSDAIIAVEVAPDKQRRSHRSEIAVAHLVEEREAVLLRLRREAVYDDFLIPTAVAQRG
jgi:hypothetical protein